MDSIQRVDELVKKNIIKYTQQKQQKMYEHQLQEYQKQRKRDALKSYTQTIKQGNRKAVQKMKQKNKKTKRKREGTTVVKDQIENVEDEAKNKKHKYKQQEIRKIEAAILARAERILQQKQLDRLDKELSGERKKTKLHELNQRCRRIAKSSAKIGTAHSVIPQERRKILEEFEQKAIQEIQQLDNIIGGIVTGNKSKQFQTRVLTVDRIKKLYNKSGDEQQEKNIQLKIQSTQTLDIDPFDNPIFTKSTEELLSLQYIPL